MKLILLLMFVSCSSLPKAKTYGGILGSTLGIGLGVLVSSNIEAKDQTGKLTNALIGAASGGLAGWFSGRGIAGDFWHEDPQHFHGPSLIKQSKQEFTNLVPLNHEGQVIIQKEKNHARN